MGDIIQPFKPMMKIDLQGKTCDTCKATYFTKAGDSFGGLVNKGLGNMFYGLDRYNKNSKLIMAVLLLENNRGEKISKRMPADTMVVLPSIKEVKDLKGSPQKLKALAQKYSKQLQSLGIR